METVDEEPVWTVATSSVPSVVPSGSPVRPVALCLATSACIRPTDSTPYRQARSAAESLERLNSSCLPGQANVRTEAVSAAAAEALEPVSACPSAIDPALAQTARTAPLTAIFRLDLGILRPRPGWCVACLPI